MSFTVGQAAQSMEPVLKVRRFRAVDVGLIDSVVHNLIDQMMQPRDPCASNIHGRSFANGFQAMKDPNPLGGIIFVSGNGIVFFFCIFYFFLRDQFLHLSLNAQRHNNAGVALIIGGSNYGRTHPIFQIKEDLVAI